MINFKVWKIKGYEGSFTDEQIINLICNGKLTGEDMLTTKELKTYIKIKDSIYEAYINKGDQNEAL